MLVPHQVGGHGDEDIIVALENVRVRRCGQLFVAVFVDQMVHGDAHNMKDIPEHMIRYESVA